MEVTIDIETIPSQDAAYIQEVKDSIQPPKTYKKAESIAEWKETLGVKAAEDEIKKTSFNGGLGQVTHIGFKIQGSEADCYRVSDTSLEQEKTLLLRFDLLMRNKIVDKTYNQPFFIGHNVAAFDLKFLYHRYVVHGIKPGFIIPWQDAAWANSYFDTMSAWVGFRDSVSLANLCKYLGIPSPKDGIDGSQVWEYIQAGKYVDVANYCKRDVEATHEAFKRLTFAA